MLIYVVMFYARVAKSDSECYVKPDNAPIFRSIERKTE